MKLILLEEPCTKSWLGDSGAILYITNNDFNMMNRKACEVSVTVSTGEVAVARVMGDIEMISEKGEKFKLLNVLYLPSVKRNLLSTNRFTRKGDELVANNKRMLIKKGKF